MMSRVLASIWVSLALAMFACQAGLWADEGENADETPAPAAAPDAKEEKPADPFVVPDGTADELEEYIHSLRNLRPDIHSQEEAREHMGKLAKAMVTAADKLLAASPNESQKIMAIRMKLESLLHLASTEGPEFQTSASEFQQQLLKDDQPAVVRVGEEYGVRLLLQQWQAKGQGADELLQAVIRLLKADVDRTSVGLVQNVGRALERSPNEDGQQLAIRLYREASPLIATSDNKQLAGYAKVLDGIVRRLTLLGKPLEISGQTIAGGDLDWESYRGKVVLVDFWATWCGPCRAELPHVKKVYEQYHDKGFDVVGIALDKTKEPVDEFLSDQEIPWATLYAADADGQHPMAEKYGVMAIPTAILVDKEGIVVSLNARGDELDRQVERLLGER